jgi:hypothetical protein
VRALIVLGSEAISLMAGLIRASIVRTLQLPDLISLIDQVMGR